MLTGIQDVHYAVADLQRATAFYRDILGMKVVQLETGWASMEFFGARIGLLSTPALDAAAQEPAATAGNAVVTLRSTDIDADVEYLARCGVRIVERADFPWGRLAAFLDSEGNMVKLMQPPVR
jgi:predicted enzyme related to lactoylglutathione lyase